MIPIYYFITIYGKLLLYYAIKMLRTVHFYKYQHKFYCIYVDTLFIDKNRESGWIGTRFRYMYKLHILMV